MTDSEKKVKDLLMKSISGKKTASDLIKEHTYTSSKSQICTDNKSRQAKVVGFGNGKRKNHIKDSLIDWNNRDFAIYILAKYKEQHKCSWKPTIPNVAVQLGRVKEAIHDTLGFCDNLVFFDYINHFFRNWSDYYKRKASNTLYLNQLRGDEAVTEFASIYDYQSSLRNYEKRNKTPEKKGCTEVDLDNAYLLGDENFVSDYGIILTCNWLILKRNYNVKKAVNYVARAFLKISKKGRADSVIKSTIKQSPYPSWFKFKNYNIILQAVGKITGKEIQMKIDFTDDNKFQFTKEKGNKDD